MTGRHAGRRQEDFWKDLLIFGLKVLFWGAVVIGVVWVFRQVPGLGAGEESDPGEIAAEVPAPVTTATTSATTTTSEPVLDPSEVTVLVLNSTDRSGLAGRVTDTISGLGYETLEAANYANPLEDSLLWYAPGHEDEAEELARVLPDMIIGPNPEAPQADLVIVLGSSFQE
ncbi:MAG: LytR C-terminal domain-containing protein [Acidimicrobiia bacterium]